MKIKALHELALIGNLGKTKEKAINLKELDQKYCIFAQSRKILAQDFQEGEILSIAETYLSRD